MEKYYTLIFGWLHVRKVKDMVGFLWTTMCAFAASTLWSVKMAGLDSVCAASTLGSVKCTVWPTAHRHAKPQRILSCWPLYY